MDETPSEARFEGPSLFDELLAVHGLIRRDLETVEVLARDAAGIAPADELRERLGELKESTMLWQLRFGCLNYCRFVHSHHRAEDALLFREVRRVEPGTEPVIERLEREHRDVAQLLDEVEQLADGLPATEDEEARRPLVAALGRLHQSLLAHLDFEEQSLEATLRRMAPWVG